MLKALQPKNKPLAKLESKVASIFRGIIIPANIAII